jgi:hypothetical protein
MSETTNPCKPKIIIFNPCKKCIVQACCSQTCTDKSDHIYLKMKLRSKLNKLKQMPKNIAKDIYDHFHFMYKGEPFIIRVLMTMVYILVTVEIVLIVFMTKGLIKTIFNAN